ncbi:hypothetical protein CFC21_065450 [Triticum aestivum]|uniref:SKP1-like protein n=3 Tax=Triticum TaxID=4564 RepID=A0A9R1H3S0_WHEAT|nr:hypothetical protein CFC21_065449 [Triticum aestivum]KAF7058379.1 hypothetical protein CFC21_065450 [Triticum aestivum]VAI16941.1 unnamed protein product [Triticum turgidum subsp. durum]
MASTAADAGSNGEVVAVGDKSNKMFTLISSDGESFEVTEEVGKMSQTIKHMIEDGCADNGIPLPNVPAKTLSKVIEYCNKHVVAAAAAADDDNNNASAGAKEDLKSFDAKFIAVDQATLFDLILAANYLDVKGLLDLSCQTAADMVKGQPVEGIRKMFNLENDFTPEEEAEIRRENPWAFDL